MKSRVIHGFGTLIVREFFLKILSLIGQIFLARLLIPSDFGIYVIIAFIINLISLFSDIGLSLAIIQKKDEPSQNELSGIFWIRILFSLILILLIWVFAPFVKVFYPSFIDANINMLRVFSVILILTSLRAIPISLLERKFKYNLISLLDVVGVFVYYVVSIGGAVLNFGVWSFIVGAVMKEIAETVILYIVEPFFPRLMFSGYRLVKLAKFGIYTQGNGFIMFLIGSITPVIGGTFSGVYSVGLLDFANNLAYIPGVIAVNFGRVAFAGYSRIQGQKDLLSKSVLSSISMLSIMLYIFPVIIFSFGSVLVPLVFSEKWVPALHALYWYSAGVIFYPIITPLGQVILSIGKSKEIFWAATVTAIFGWSLSYLFIHTIGFTGIAIANFFIYFLLFCFYIYILKLSKFNVLPFVFVSVPKAIVAIATIFLSFMISTIFPDKGVVAIIIKITFSTSLYFALLLIFVRKDTLEFVKLLFGWMRSKSL